MAEDLNTERKLEAFDNDGHSKIPFQYEGNVLGLLREDQIPRFFGALTDAGKLPTRRIKFSEIIAMQNRVNNGKVEAMRNKLVKAAGRCPLVVQHDGKLYLADGHHRATAEWLDGAEEIEVHFKDIEEMTNVVKADTIIKVDESLGLVFGWGIVCKVDGEDYYDLQDDHIPEMSMMKASVDFMQNSRMAKEMHDQSDTVGKGSVVFAFPLTTDVAKAMGLVTKQTGLMIAMKPDSADMLAKFKDGTYTGFSIGGQRIKDEEIN